MKAIVSFGGFGGKLEVQGGEAIISSDPHSNFSVHLEKIFHSQIDKVTIMPGSSFRMELEQKNGQVILIEESIYNKGKLAFKRFLRPRAGEILEEKYLTRKGRWAPEPKGYGPPLDDTLLIPISFSEKG